MPSRKLTDDQVREAHARCVAGERLKDVAAELGMHPESMRRRAKQLGLAKLPSGPIPTLSDAQVREAHARCMAGEKQAVIAAEYGVKPSAMQQRRKRLGLPALPCGTGKATEPRNADALLKAYCQYKAGRLVRQIAQDLGYASESGVCEAFRRWRDWLEANA